MKPAFRWVGGKTKMLPHILEFLPSDPVNYFEPFFGGGAVFFEYGFKAARAYVNDVNKPLMVAYEGLKCGYVDVRTKAMRYQDWDYYDLRALFNEEKKQVPHNPVKLAVLFIYMNNLCYNGVYRENLSGGMNSPQGSSGSGPKKKPYDYRRIDWEHLARCGAALQGVHINWTSFDPWPWEGCLPGLGDVVVYDPPFFGEYSDYHSSRFGELQHRQLHQQAQEHADRGATVVVCGSNNDWSWGIYGKPTRVVTVKRTVGNSLRGDATEALYVYGA